MLPYETAVEIVREVAGRFKAEKALKQVDDFDPDHFENAKRNFAEEMTDGEKPLLMMDTSLRQNGKAGLLITNRAAYSTHPREWILLRKIRKAGILPPEDPPLWLRLIVGGRRARMHAKYLQIRIAVNGANFHRTAKSSPKFWVEILKVLGGADRQLFDERKAQREVEDGGE